MGGIVTTLPHKDGGLVDSIAVSPVESIGASTPATLFLDTFTDTNGTLLTSHTMDVGGGTWATTGLGTAPPISSNRVTATSGHRAMFNSAVSDCTIIADLHHGASNGQNAILMFRSPAGVWNNAWEIALNYSFFTLGYWNGGSWTQVSSVALSSGGITRQVRVELLGTSIKIYTDGVLRHDVTNAVHQTGTHHGVKFDTLGGWIDNFHIQEYNAL